MFVYNKQKSQRDKEPKSQSVESTMLKQVEIDASKNESRYRIEKHRIHNYNREKYNEIKREEYREKTCNELKTTDILNKIEYESE